MFKVATAAILIQTRGVQSVFSLEKLHLCYIRLNNFRGHIPILATVPVMSYVYPDGNFRIVANYPIRSTLVPNRFASIPEKLVKMENALRPIFAHVKLAGKAFFVNIA